MIAATTLLCVGALFCVSLVLACILLCCGFFETKGDR